MLGKRVSWKGIFVREYNCTVGDHPMCSDNLPLSLDWSHSRHEKVTNIDDGSNSGCGCRERKSNYRFPRRLSYADRQKRIFGGEGSEEGEQSSAESITSGNKTEWTKPASLKVNGNEGRLERFLEEDKAYQEASQEVIYCRHAKDEDDYDDDDSINYFIDWRC